MATQRTTRSNRIPAAGAAMALAAMLAGCQANSTALTYAQEAHAQQVAAWCRYSHVGGTTPSLQEQCIRHAWINVPPGECFTKPCTETGLYGLRYHARPAPIEK